MLSSPNESAVLSSPKRRGGDSNPRDREPGTMDEGRGWSTRALGLYAQAGTAIGITYWGDAKLLNLDAGLSGVNRVGQESELLHKDTEGDA